MISAMRAASKLPGRGPPDVDDAHAPAVIKKSDYDYDDILSKYSSSPKLNTMDHD